MTWKHRLNRNLNRIDWEMVTFTFLMLLGFICISTVAFLGLWKLYEMWFL